MTGGAKRGVPSPWLLEEPEETRGLGVDGIRQQQQQIIQGTDVGGVGTGPARCLLSPERSLRPLRIRGTVGPLKLSTTPCLRMLEAWTRGVIPGELHGSSDSLLGDSVRSALTPVSPGVTVALVHIFLMTNRSLHVLTSH